MRHEIEQHQAKNGVLALPSENEMVDRYNVSRATVRNALDMLELPAEGRVYRVERLRVVQEEPMSIQTAYLPAHLFPELEKHDLSMPLYRLCEDVYNQRLWTGRQILRARTATPYEARLLCIPKNAAVMYAERITYSAAGNAVEYLEAVWRGDRYDFKVTLSRPVSA